MLMCHYCRNKGHIRQHCYKLKNVLNSHGKRNVTYKENFQNIYKRNIYVRNNNMHRYHVNEKFTHNVYCFSCGKFGKV